MRSLQVEAMYIPFLVQEAGCSVFDTYTFVVPEGHGRMPAPGRHRGGAAAA